MCGFSTIDIIGLTQASKERLAHFVVPPISFLCPDYLEIVAVVKTKFVVYTLDGIASICA